MYGAAVVDGGLNREQRRACSVHDGVTLVIAGAGTGKTRTLIHKIIKLIVEDGLKPESILVLTFSRKAAEEINERIGEKAGKSAGCIVTGTFHSFCLRFLRENNELFTRTFGYPGFPAVLDDDARSAMLKAIIKDDLDSFKGLPLEVIGSLLNDYTHLDGGARKKLRDFGIEERLAGVRERFRAEKRRRCCVDFEDMIEYVIGMLVHDDPLRERTRRRFACVLVDEFQDTSPENIELLRLIVPEDAPRLFVVGDDWQSIYGFRNSRVEHIVRMKRVFPGARIHRLCVNYRSRREIVAVSNRFIKRNRFRTRKRIASNAGRGGLVRAHLVAGIEEEARLIGELIEIELVVSDDIAVLYRNNWQGRQLRRRLAENSSHRRWEDVVFMTMHASKGLEYHTVIVAGIADGVLPDGMSDLEEERRLLYVAITRARERLHIICHCSGTEGVSRFGSELGVKFTRTSNPRH